LNRDVPGLRCELSLAPQTDGDIGVAFDVSNAGAEPVEIGFIHPFLGFELAVDSDDGPIPVVQPAYSVAGRAQTLTIAPGATERIETPVRLRFDPQVPPSGGDEPTRWSLAHEPVPVRLEATLRLDGRSLGPCRGRLDPGADGG
jgi:hypothetical protein